MTMSIVETLILHNTITATVEVFPLYSITKPVNAHTNNHAMGKD